MDDFSGEKRDDFYKIGDTDEQNSEFQEKLHVTKSSESREDINFTSSSSGRGWKFDSVLHVSDWLTLGRPAFVGFTCVLYTPFSRPLPVHRGGCENVDTRINLVNTDTVMLHYPHNAKCVQYIGNHRSEGWRQC